MLYLIAVGVDRYDPRVYGDCNLKQCVNDVHKVVDKIQPDDLTLLTNEDATVGNFTGALEAVAKDAKAGDLVILYMSSHGTYSIKGAKASTGRCFYDNVLWDKDFVKKIKSFKPGVLFQSYTDSCHSESNSRNVSLPIDENIKARVTTLSIDLTIPTNGSLASVKCMTNFFGACQHDSVSYEGSNGGFFTNAFIKQFDFNKSPKQLLKDLTQELKGTTQVPSLEYWKARTLINKPLNEVVNLQ